MSRISMELDTAFGSVPLVHGDASIAAGENTTTIDVSDKFPEGIEGALFSDKGAATLPYSFTESNGKVVVHAPPYVIDQSGKVVPRSFEATFKYLIVGKR